MDFNFLGSEVTADGDCSHEIKRCLLLGRKATTKLDSILKSRDITSPTKICLVKAMVFPVVMYGCKSWTIKKAEHWRIDAFELWCWRRLLRVPWTARRSNLSILKEISPECSLEELMLKLKRQYFGHLMQRTDSLEKTLMLGKIESRRRRGRQTWDGWMASPTQWTWVGVSSRSWWWTGRSGVLWFMGSQSRTQVSDWTAWLLPRSLRPALLMVVSRNTVNISLKTQRRKRFSLHTLVPSVSFYSSFTSLKVTYLHVKSSWYLYVISYLIFEMCLLMHPA